MKAFKRYKSVALFDLILSVCAIMIALISKEVFTYAAIAYFVYLAIESLKEYLALHR